MGLFLQFDLLKDTTFLEPIVSEMQSLWSGWPGVEPATVATRTIQKYLNDVDFLWREHALLFDIL